MFFVLIINIIGGILYHKSLVQHREAGYWKAIDDTFPILYKSIEIAIVDGRDNIPALDSEFWKD